LDDWQRRIENQGNSKFTKYTLYLQQVSIPKHYVFGSEQTILLVLVHETIHNSSHAAVQVTGFGLGVGTPGIA
jgi:hypothetical protein